MQEEAGNERDFHRKSNDRSMEEPEEEENRNPNPDNNGDIDMVDADKISSKKGKIHKKSYKDKDNDDREVNRYENTEEDREYEGDEENKYEIKEDGTINNSEKSIEQSITDESKCNPKNYSRQNIKDEDKYDCQDIQQEHDQLIKIEYSNSRLMDKERNEMMNESAD